MERLKITPTQTAILLFLVAFVSGALCIYFTILELVLPLAIVFIYSAILYIMYRSRQVVLSSFEKNTPYYLGLLFTLFSLFSLSIKTGFSFDSEAPLLTTMSIALSTTILGLILRQILLNVSAPISEDYHSLLKRSLEQIKELQEAFEHIKSQIVAGIDEFEVIKKTLIERDDTATSQSLEELRQKIFSGLEGTFSKKMKGVLDSVSDFYIEDYETTIGQILPDSYKIEISERLDNFYKEVMDSFTKNTEEFLHALKQISNRQKKDFQKKESENLFDSVNRQIRSYDTELNGIVAYLEEKFLELQK